MKEYLYLQRAQKHASLERKGGLYIERALNKGEMNNYRRKSTVFPLLQTPAKDTYIPLSNYIVSTEDLRGDAEFCPTKKNFGEVNNQDTIVLVFYFFSSKF